MELACAPPGLVVAAGESGAEADAFVVVAADIVASGLAGSAGGSVVEPGVTADAAALSGRCEWVVFALAAVAGHAVS